MITNHLYIDGGPCLIRLWTIISPSISAGASHMASIHQVAPASMETPSRKSTSIEICAFVFQFDVSTRIIPSWTKSGCASSDGSSLKLTLDVVSVSNIKAVGAAANNDEDVVMHLLFLVIIDAALIPVTRRRR